MLLNAYSTLWQPPEPDFPHELLGRRDASDPELQGHLEGFVGYVLSTREGMTYTLYSVMRHLQRVRAQFSLEVAEADLPAATAWAERANAVWFWPDGSVCDPQGRVLVSQDADELDESAEIPFPADAAERKRRTEQLLLTRGLRSPSSLPPVPAEGEAAWRTPAEVVARIRGLSAAALMAGARGEGLDATPDDLEGRLPGYAPFLSPQEAAFMAEQTSPPEQIAKFSWRYEALNVLLWALGQTKELAFPLDICDVEGTLDAVDALAELAQLSAQSATQPPLRPAFELLDALDLTFRLHWVVREAELQKQPVPAGLEGGVIMERHYALNWLTCFEDAPWDEVDTPT